MVMIGLFMRPAALVLGLMTFFASYLQTIELGVVDELGTFWRDLVLIAALMLTYAENAPRDQQMRSAIRHKVMPRRVDAAAHAPPAPRRGRCAHRRPGRPPAREGPAPLSSPRAVRQRPDVGGRRSDRGPENVFADTVAAR